MKEAQDKETPGGGTIFVASRLVVDADTVFVPGALAVSGEAVLAAGHPGAVTRAVPAGFARRELPGVALLPGLVNAHTHLQIPRSVGAAPGVSFVDWIFRVIAWRLGAAPAEFACNLAAAAAESLAAGVTAAGEIGGPDLAAYEACPLRARVFAEGIGFLPEAAGEVAASVQSALDVLAETAARRGHIVPGVSPHTLYSVGPELLRMLAGLARDRSLPLALHLAESPEEMEFLRTGGGDVARRLYPAVGKDVSFFRGIGESIPGYLRSAGLLREGLLLVHNVHLSREDAGALRGGGARFVLCPRSNAALGNGSPDLTFFVDAGIPFALGTDSLGSVPDLSPWEEIRSARSLYHGSRDDEALCRLLFRAVTEEGAAVLFLPGGTLRPGAPADLAAVDDPGGGGGAFFRRLADLTTAGRVRLTAVAGEIFYDRT